MVHVMQTQQRQVEFTVYGDGLLLNINGRASFLKYSKGSPKYSIKWIRRKGSMTLNLDQLLLGPWIDLVLSRRNIVTPLREF